MRGENISYEYALRQAQRANDQRSLTKLQRIGPTPYDGPHYLKRLFKQRHILHKYRGAVHQQALRDKIFSPWPMLKQHEYSLFDKLNWFRGK